MDTHAPKAASQPGTCQTAAACEMVNATATHHPAVAEREKRPACTSPSRVTDGSCTGQAVDGCQVVGIEAVFYAEEQDDGSKSGEIVGEGSSRHD